MVEEDWQPLRDLGFNDEAVLEVAHIVGIFNYLTRLADGLGLQLDAGTIRAAETGEALKRHQQQPASPGGSPRTLKTVVALTLLAWLRSGNSRKMPPNCPQRGLG
jgi:hypothetical protein